MSVGGSLLDWALTYARAGWPVFPLQPGTKIPFEGSAGVDDATRDEELITALWTACPDCNIGLATGHGMAVVDLDLKDGKNGLAALAELVGAQAFPDGAGIPTVRTPSGGLHLFLATTGTLVRNRAGLGRADSGIDIRGVGGYVVGAPSVLPNGEYAWMQTGPLPEMPSWLLEAIGRPNVRAPGERPKLEERPPATPEVLDAARLALKKHGPAVEGRAGDQHTFKAGAILLRDYALDFDEALELAREWNATCVPPWDDDDLERKIANGQNYGQAFGEKRWQVEHAQVIAQARAPRERPVLLGPEPEAGEEGADPDQEREPLPVDQAEGLLPNISLIRAQIPRSTLLCALRRDDKEKIKPCGLNASLLVRHLFHGQFRFNLLEKTVDATRSIFRRETPDTLPKAVADYLAGDAEICVDLSTNMIQEALLNVSMENAFNPLEEYLCGLVWDGVGRLDTWLETYARARTLDDEGNDIQTYIRAVGSRWMIAAAARALYPGCKADTVLTLEGDQGVGKSTIFDVLGGQWFADTPLRIGDKDANLGAGSSWIIELAELASLKKAESEQQKAFLSARTDKFRVPYGKAQQSFPRACIFAGTTNETGGYMVDRTGNRRYWCVRSGGPADITGLRRDRDQLWAEAVARLREASLPELRRPDDHEQGPEGERWWFEKHEQVEADKITADRMAEDTPDTYKVVMAKYFATIGAKKCDAGLTLTDIVTEALQIPVERINRKTLADAGHALRELGWMPRGRMRPRLWFRDPAGLAPMPPRPRPQPDGRSVPDAAREAIKASADARAVAK